jgi:N-acetylglucosaminyldiphosphoundecaprenol N-acetyl-beta-D-mannosaminyltransferase
MADCVKRITILGIPVDAVAQDCLQEVIENLYSLKANKQIYLLGFHDLMNARFRKERREAIEKSALVLPVSHIIVKAAAFLHKPVPTLIRPYPFVIKLLTILEDRGKSVYLLGTSMKNVRNAESSIRKTFPGLQVVGRYSARYPKNMEKNVITAIKKASPALLLAGRGIKGKNIWLHRKRNLFSPGLSLWEKHALDVFAGKRKKPLYNSFFLFLKAVVLTIIRPWRFLLVFRYMYFYLLLLVEKIKTRKS